MLTTFKRQATLLLLIVIIIPMIAACGSTAGTGSTAATASETTSNATSAPAATSPADGAMTGTADYASLTGAINIDGSSTVEPLSLAVAEEFKKVAPNVNITVGRSGTGGGFEKFCNGETDANDASRPIKSEEAEKCKARNISPVEVFLGLDGLAVVVNPENSFIKGLNYDQLKLIYTEGGATTWDQVDPSFPKEKIDKYGPDADSGTLDFFKEAIKLRGTESNEDEFTGDYTASADDNTLVQGVEGSPFAIGFFGYAYYEQEKDRLKAIPIAKTGTEYIAPSADTVESNTYPLSRPLFIYPSAMGLKEKPELAAFVQFYLQNVKDVISDVGYFPGSDERYAEAQKNFAGATK